ncbi:hypothetical protein JCM1840_003356 [Sporobolomyces johnsonii]
MLARWASHRRTRALFQLVLVAVVLASGYLVLLRSPDDSTVAYPASLFSYSFNSASRNFSHPHGPSQLATTPPLLLAPLPRTPSSPSTADPWVLAKPASQVPPCERIFLFTFMPWWGFASEYILYVRAAAMAEKLGYTFLEDDRNWNYGRLTNYFRPRTLSCVPPRDWSDPRKAFAIHSSASWATDKRGRPRSRLRYSRQVLSNLDDWTRETYLSSAAARAELAELQGRDRAHARDRDRWILEEGGSLPGVFEEVFGDQAEVVERFWRLTGEMRRTVEDVRARARVEGERWLEGEEDGDAKRGPVIGLHIRLGDKASEYAHDSQEMGISNEFGNLTVYVEAAHDAYRRLVPSPSPSLYPSLSSTASTTSRRFSPHAQPTLLVMTAEPSISALLAEIPLAQPFRIVQTPPPHVLSEGEGQGKGGDGRVRLEEAERAREQLGKAGSGPKAYAGGAPAPAPALTSSGTDLATGYTQSAFNALPLAERVAHTQAFVRDLTLLAASAEGVDAMVVSGASNIGRLAMLIGGKDAVIGPRDARGRSLGGRIRSVDAHFYPTAYSSAVYSQITDVEDLENAAFLPEEQHKAEAKAKERKKGKKGGAKQRLERRGRGRGEEG